MRKESKEKAKVKTPEEKRKHRRELWRKKNTPPEGCNPCPKGCLECPFPTCEFNGIPRKEERSVLKTLTKTRAQSSKNIETIDNKTYHIAGVYSRIQWM